jgi:hypothetical protein
MQIFLRRCSLWLVNKSSIPILLKILGASSAQSSPTKSSNGSPSKGSPSKAVHFDHAPVDLAGLTDPKTVDYAQQILNYISKHCAALYYSHLPQFAKEVHSKTTPALLETTLRALAAVAALGTDQTPVDRYGTIAFLYSSSIWQSDIHLPHSKLPGAMSKFVLGQNRELAKFAARYLANSKDKGKHVPTLVEVSDSKLRL